ncbi:MAG: hypothetical protein LQ344_002742 [Seirophora lacunosa]|nr:MAG: hypothetical protein LQ344_002742 [Seirophora lacunosa]
MVSFWPWKGDDNSPASFEKALSTLSDKITKTNNKLDTLRQRSRRYSVLWTLYTSFAYLLCTIVLVLVVGWKEWGVAEYVGVTGGPPVIYLVRLAITAAYGIRISNLQSQADTLQKQRDATIEKLKTATRYNTTQELLKKYGGTPPSKERLNETNTPRASSTQKGSSAVRQGRTNFAPPPTANIPGRNGAVSLPGTPQQASPRSHDQQLQAVPRSAATAVSPWQDPAVKVDDSAEFAPNAFPSVPQYIQHGEGSSWYDRLMDLVLGEDETLPRNRLALICHKCRLVNGQAPPGAQRLEDVGKWRCIGCGTMNGEEKEETTLLKQIREHAANPMAQPRDVSGKAALADTSGSEGSGQEEMYEAGEDEDPSNTDSSGSEHKQDKTRGTAAGVQKTADSTRRRSQRVQSKNGQGKKG